MAEIRNYTLDFGFGRAPRALDFAGAKSAFAEVSRARPTAVVTDHG